MRQINQKTKHGGYRVRLRGVNPGVSWCFGRVADMTIASLLFRVMLLFTSRRVGPTLHERPPTAHLYHR